MTSICKPVVLAASLWLGVVSTALAQAPAAPQGATPQQAAAPRDGAVLAEYRLAAGDVIRVLVYQNPDLSFETRIADSGVVSFPLLGNIRLGGLTVNAAEQLIAEGLRNGRFVKQPQVTIAITQVRGNQASVLGQVNRPGRFPLESADMRLSDLIATAGGVAPSGGDMVVVTGTRDGKAYRVEVDFPTVFQAGGAARDIIMKNGDTVWVDRQQLVYIYGEVQRPGALRLERGMTLLQALATGGGLTQRGTEKGIRVHRKNADGRIQVITPTMDERVQDGDVVYVRESLF